MPFLQSHAIEAVAYDQARRQLRAKFRDSGAVVIYDDVPQHIYDSLIFADSIRGFFRDRIEGHFPAHRA